ncbi:lytic transglycosylase domain-containing protein [Exilibacterium tricleocarpae]|uniref:lytic transglycosylase domain-containing protein n=1 Tax=Exilibacterium tricleocarpae TaxID=2591008 RepID=UPI003CCC7EBD
MCTCHSALAQPKIEPAPPQFEVEDELRRLLVETIEAADSFDDRFDAEVWLVSKSPPLRRFIDNPKKRMSMLKSIHRAARRAGLQPEVVLAVIEVESGFNRYAVSRVGAQGLMQVMPFWKHEIGRPEDNLIDLETNLKYGCAILKHYLNRSNGHLAEALARYNGSYGRYTYVEKVMMAWQKYWR